MSRERAPDPQPWEVATCPPCRLVGAGVLRGEVPHVSGGGVPVSGAGAGTYCSSPRRSCPHSRCHNRTASGLARNGYSCSGTGRARRYAHLGEARLGGKCRGIRDGVGAGMRVLDRQGQDGQEWE